MNTRHPEGTNLPLLPWCLWSVAGALMLYLWPSLLIDMPIWKAAGVQSQGMLLLAFLYLGTAALVAYECRAKKPTGYLVILGISFGACGVFTLHGHLFGLRKMLLLVPWFLAPVMMVSGMLLLRVMGARLFHLMSGVALAAALIFFAAIVVNPGNFLQKIRGYRQDLTATVKGQKAKISYGLQMRRLNTAYYPLKVTTIVEASLQNKVPGGGWSKIDKHNYLLCTGEGKLFICSNLDNPETFKIAPLPFAVPINREAFIAEAKSNSIIHHQWFRVASAFCLVEGDTVTIYSIYHHWDSQSKRFFTRMAKASGPLAGLLSASTSMSWQVVWESTPGLPIHEVPKPGKLAFAGLQIGGRIAQLDQDTLIFTVGDHEFDGVNADEMYPQDPVASYGKTFLYKISSSAVIPFTMGNRNPQGLFIGADGRIWETEHGPQGGDELNLLRQGANYGWPLATIGTEYRKHFWPLTRTPGDHAGYTTPVYAWGKSIGISNLIEMRGDLFTAWRGHLMISSLGGHNLFRVRLEGNRVLSIEEIPLGRKIRDLTETAAGNLVLWTDLCEIIVLEPTEQQSLSIPASFGQCIVCHSPYEGSANGAGPYLWGLASREIASAEGYPYSEAMRKQKGRWTKEQLDFFLQNPQAAIPGTIMMIPGVPDAKERKEIIDFLLKLE